MIVARRMPGWLERWVPWLVAVGILSGIWLPFFVTVFHDLPFGSHSWKQGDCFAIAQRFLEDDNWNILSPRAQSLIPTDGRVNTELPLVPYLAAVGARVVGETHLEEVFRSLTLLLSALAPLGVFGLVWGRSRGLLEAVFVMVLVAAFPILAYYGAGFHPDSGAFGFLVLGMTLVLGWTPSPATDRSVVVGVGFMTLGGLVKMSMAPYLFVPAILLLYRNHRMTGEGGLTLLRIIPRTPPFRALMAGGVLIIVQFAALKTLAAGYSPTFFTASPHPFRSLGHLAMVVQRARRVWLEDLFSGPQLWVLSAGVVFSLIRCFRRKGTGELRVATATAAWVMVGLFVLFGKQFAWHDYYAIATFYPTAVLIAIQLTLAVHRNRAVLENTLANELVVFALVGSAVLMAAGLRPVLTKRTTRWYRLQIEWLTDARSVLNSCGTACAGPVAVLGSKPPNLALTYLDRQGYVVGPNLHGGVGTPDFRSLAGLVTYLDRRYVKVLVARKQALEAIPADALNRLFETVAEKKDVVVFIRRSQ